jgi:hypothetical protein
MNAQNRQPSEARRAAGRLNGQKAKGCKTPEGKAKSAQNAVTHGVYSTRLILQCEDQARFDTLYKSWAITFEPQNPLEREILLDLVSVHWQIRRLKNMELENVEIAMYNRRKLMNEQWTIIGEHGRICDAMEHLANTSKLPSLINRQISRLNREHDRLLKFFQQVRRDFPNLVEPPGIPPPEVKNEGNESSNTDEMSPEITPEQPETAVPAARIVYVASTERRVRRNTAAKTSAAASAATFMDGYHA